MLAGGLAVLLALLMGNLPRAGVARQRSGRPPRVSGNRCRLDYCGALGAVIPNTINKFPLDIRLRRYCIRTVIAMPFGLWVVGLALKLGGGRGSESGVRIGIGSGIRGQGDRSGRWSALVSLFTCLLSILALGALGVINTWDLPTYALLVAGACVVAGWRARRWLGVAGGLLLAAMISALAVAAYWPLRVLRGAGGAGRGFAGRTLARLGAWGEPAWMTGW